MHIVDHRAASGMAKLLFKAHQELASLASQLSMSDSLFAGSGFSLNLGDLQAAVLGAGLPHGLARLRLREGTRLCELEVQASSQGPQARVVLRDTATGFEHELNGEKIFRAKVPPEFEALHQSAKTYLRAQVPPALWTPIGTPTERPAQQLNQEKSGNADTEARLPAEPTGDAVNNEAAPKAEQRNDEDPLVIVARSGEPDLRFRGRLLYSSRSLPAQGRWVELQAYQTKGGRFVGVETGRSWHLGEVTRRRTVVADKLEDLAPFFGNTALGKHACDALGITRYQDID